MMASKMEMHEKLALINENLAEVLNPELIERVLTEGRNLRVYWGKFRYCFVSDPPLFFATRHYPNEDADSCVSFKEPHRQDDLIADTLSLP
jgi:hypothetical protein